MTYPTSQFGSLWRQKAFQAVELVRDFTVAYQRRHGNVADAAQDWRVRIAQMARDAMARSLRVAEGNDAAAIEHIAAARASLQELLVGFRDEMRRDRLPLWDKDDVMTKEIRALAYLPDRSMANYEHYLQPRETAANVALCLLHQANFLLDQQLRSLQRRAYPRWSSYRGGQRGY